MKDFFEGITFESFTPDASDGKMVIPIGNQENTPQPQEQQPPSNPNGGTTIQIPTSMEEFVIKEALDYAKIATQCFTEYMMCREREETERHRITSMLTALRNQMETQKLMYLAELEKAHEVRRRLFDEAIAAQRYALERNDKAMLHEVYCYTLDLYKTPMQELSDKPPLSFPGF